MLHALVRAVYAVLAACFGSVGFGALRGEMVAIGFQMSGLRPQNRVSSRFSVGNLYGFGPCKHIESSANGRIEKSQYTVNE